MTRMKPNRRGQQPLQKRQDLALLHSLITETEPNFFLFFLQCCIFVVKMWGVWDCGKRNERIKTVKRIAHCALNGHCSHVSPTNVNKSKH